jgi:hypothetical protein
MRAAAESAGVAHTESAVGEAQQGAVAIGGELVAHDAVLDDLLLPFVLEHIGRIPHQNAAGHPFAFGWQWWARCHHVDRPAFATVDGRHAEPLGAFIRVGDRRPHRLDREGQPAFEGKHGAIAFHREVSVAPCHFCSRWFA